MPLHSHVRIVKLRKWFPPNDPLAAKIARICILREDMLIEMQGILAEDIEELDGHSPQFRRMYFLRNLWRTQMELSGAIRVLLRNDDFNTLLAREGEDVKAQFAAVASSIEKVHPILKDVRNDISGHVLEKAVQAALERIDSEYPETFGFLDAGPKANQTHYKFAGELVAEILLKGVPNEERRVISSSKFALIADLLPAFSLIERCLIMYAQDRHLPFD